MAARNGCIYEIDAASFASTWRQMPGAVLAGQSRVSFAQLVDKLYWVEGSTLCYGSSNGSGWTLGTVATMKSGSQAIAMPSFSFIKEHRFRLLGVPPNSDTIYPSAIGQAYTAGVNGDWNELQAIRVGDGNGDPITALVSGQATRLIVLKQSSVWEVDTADVDSVNWTINRLTNIAGCVAGATVVQLGQEVYFLSRYGVLTLGAIDKLDSISKAASLSAPMQPIMDRINWAAIGTAHATKWRDMYVLFVPLDDSPYPNVALPFNLTTRQWMDAWDFGLTDQEIDHRDTDSMVDEAGNYLVDELGNIIVDHLHITGTYSGIAASCITNFQGREETILADSLGRVFLLDDAALADDDTLVSQQQIPTEALLRAWDFEWSRLRKLPFTLEVEFQNSSSRNITALLVLDGRQTTPDVPLSACDIVESGITANNRPVIPMTIPVKIENTRLIRVPWVIRDFRTFREAQVQITSTDGQLGLRGVRMSAFIDTAELTN
jgi:hypothetical protein